MQLAYYFLGLVGLFGDWKLHYSYCLPLLLLLFAKTCFDIFIHVCSPQNNVSREAQTMNLVDHPNVLKSHCSFVSDHNLWVVMPFMAGGSCLHILKAAYPDGFEELVIATILREVLKGLDYLHHHGHIHRDVKVSIDPSSWFSYLFHIFGLNTFHLCIVLHA